MDESTTRQGARDADSIVAQYATAGEGSFGGKLLVVLEARA